MKKFSLCHGLVSLLLLAGKKSTLKVYELQYCNWPLPNWKSLPFAARTVQHIGGSVSCPGWMALDAGADCTKKTGLQTLEPPV
ncbi:hypothetical protein C8R47DRAFT_147482 [Mycena vitilis]|nr:hypothetical protein C8R47DRAFT_147482 [Mycena vitilis]